MSVLKALRGYLPPTRSLVIGVAAILVIGVVVTAGWQVYRMVTTTSVTAYFDNSNGIYVGDRVKILGVDVGRIDDIVPAGDKVKVSFHFDSSHKVPADAKAAILSQSLVSSRAIQLTPAYTGGDALEDGDSIPIERTAVPVEWDDFRGELQALAESVGPTELDENGALAGFIDSTADALDGKGNQINSTITKLSDAMTTLSDGREDMFATVRNLQVFMSALAAGDQQIVELNTNLASVTDVLTNSDAELSSALQSVDTVASRIGNFVAENRDGVSTSVDDLTQVTTLLNESRPVIEQILHSAPNAIANFYNIIQPAQSGMTGALSFTQFQNPLQFVCGAIQAASQKGAAESAKLCVQHLGPVLQTLQMNYPPVGANPIAGIQNRPEQIDYSQDALQGTVPTARPVPRNSGLAGLLGVSGAAGQSGGGR